MCVSTKIVSDFLTDGRWFYRGNDLSVQGPYSTRRMLSWFKGGYFKPDLPVRADTFPPDPESNKEWYIPLNLLWPKVHHETG